MYNETKGLVNNTVIRQNEAQNTIHNHMRIDDISSIGNYGLTVKGFVKFPSLSQPASRCLMALGDDDKGSGVDFLDN